ncbi:MAG: lipoyl synthase [Candidatus Omnitrophota bacterium]|nr:lipoyl synthase [Candidatus Omnitrophota bacterium]
MRSYVPQKPLWLDKKLNLGACREVKELLRASGVRTVCEESLCPNITECFSVKTATVMILGSICSRNCTFCAVQKGIPSPIDAGEPERVRLAAEKLGLRYVVVTSVTRDDLADGGSELFSRTCRELKKMSPSPQVELLIPDFQGKIESIERIAYSGAEVISHNLETTPCLYIEVRKGAAYERSLDVLRRIKELNPEILTKSGLMLGLGESGEDILAVLLDLRSVSCDFLTLGQYLPPTRHHHPLAEYISPEKFNFFASEARNLGFKGVQSSPYTRSSYRAHTFLPVS